MCLKTKIENIQVRTVLYYLSLSLFVVSYMVRTDMNVAIVAMVGDNHTEVSNETSTTSACFGSNDLATNETSAVQYSINYNGNLGWTTKEQSYVFASFYWMYTISTILGAIAARKWGMKKVCGFSLLISSFCNYFMPMASKAHYGYAILLRSIQGFVLGVIWPTMFTGQTHWYPEDERSSFLNTFQGYNLGMGITYPIGGLIIMYYGWESVFYTTSTIVILWTVVWYFLAYDSPDLHPRISSTEKQYIKENVETVSYEDSKHREVPWLKIITSGPVIVLGLTCFGWMWVKYIFILAIPQYLKYILGFNIGHSGILTGLPFLVTFPMGFIFHHIAEKLIKSKLLKPINVRKLFVGLGGVFPGILCFVVGSLECNSYVILPLIVIAMSFPSAMFSGYPPNIAAIAPEFSGATSAIIQSMFMMASMTSPLVIGYLTQDGQTLQAWQNVFNVAAGMSIVTFIPYLIWGTDKVQPWNYSNVSSINDDKQSEKMLSELQDKNCIITKNQYTEKKCTKRM